MQRRPRSARTLTPSAELAQDIVACLSERPHTRKQLCERLSVSRTTLGRALAQLVKDHAVSTHVQQAPRRGRPVEVFTVESDVAYSIGLDISRSFARGMVTNRAGHVLAEVCIDNTAEVFHPDVIDELCAALKRELDAVGALVTWVSHIGLGVPKPIVSSNLARTGINLADLAAAETIIRTYFDAPIVADNSVRMAAIGEAHSGAGKYGGIQMYVRASKGIFACSLTDDIVSSGARGFAGEIGHATVPGSTRECFCGKIGCLEQEAALDAVCAAAQVSTTDELIDAVRRGDPVACAAVDTSTSALAEVLAVTVLLTNPARIIVGGELPIDVPGYLEQLRDKLQTHVIPGINDDIEFVPAALGPTASLVGAIVAAQRFVTGSTCPAPFAWHTAIDEDAQTVG